MSVITKFRNCHLCEAMSGVEIQIGANAVKSIKVDMADQFSRGHICPKAIALKDLHEDPDRLRHPIKKTADGWEKITWEEAFDEVAIRLKNVQDLHGANAVGVYQGNPSCHNLGTMLFATGFIRSLKTTNRFLATSVDQLPHHLAASTIFGHKDLMPVPDIDRTNFG